MRHLQAGGTVLHLDLSLDGLTRRLGDLDARGVASAPGRDLSDLYAERQPLYLKYADQTVVTDGLTQDAVVNHIITLLKNNPNYLFCPADIE